MLHVVTTGAYYPPVVTNWKILTTGASQLTAVSLCSGLFCGCLCDLGAAQSSAAAQNNPQVQTQPFVNKLWENKGGKYFCGGNKGGKYFQVISEVKQAQKQTTCLQKVEILTLALSKMVSFNVEGIAVTFVKLL